MCSHDLALFHPRARATAQLAATTHYIIIYTTKPVHGIRYLLIWIRRRRREAHRNVERTENGIRYLLIWIRRRRREAHRETWKELRTCLREAEMKGKLVVLEFMAPWSEPSKAMEQPYKDVASEFAKNGNVQFVALNFDKFEFLGQKLRVEAMPVFLMVRSFKVKDRIVALTGEELSNKITKMLASESSSTGAVELSIDQRG